MRQNEGIRIEPLVRALQQDGPRKGRIQGRPVGISGIPISGAVRADLRREWEAAQQRSDSIELPAADQLVSEAPGVTEPVLALAERQLIKGRDAGLAGFL